MKTFIPAKVRVLIYSLLTNVRVNFVGQLALSEIFAVISSLSLKSWVLIHKKNPDLKRINTAYVVFLFAQIISDIINESSITNLLRGQANIGMAIVVTTYLTRQFSLSRSLILYYFIGNLISLAILGQDRSGISLQDMGFFKFTLAPIINALLLILSLFFLSSGKKKTMYLIALFASYGLFSVSFDFRSNGAFWLLISILIVTRQHIKKLTTTRVIMLSIISLVFLQMLYMVYVTEVMSGSVGGNHSKVQLLRLKNPYNPINLLETGRAEVFAALSAIQDKPWIGHGSWALDKSGIYNSLVFKLHGEEDKFEDFIENTKSSELIIPSHSVIIGAWVTSGIVGFFALSFIFILVMKRSFQLLTNREILESRYLAILLYFIFNTFWNFLFSPLSHIKQSLPLMISFIIVLYNGYSRLPKIPKKKPIKVGDNGTKYRSLEYVN